MSIRLTYLECPKCKNVLDEDRCPIGSDGIGHCYRCGEPLFKDTPKRREFIFR